MFSLQHLEVFGYPADNCAQCFPLRLVGNRTHTIQEKLARAEWQLPQDIERLTQSRIILRQPRYRVTDARSAVGFPFENAKFVVALSQCQPFGNDRVAGDIEPVSEDLLVDQESELEGARSLCSFGLKAEELDGRESVLLSPTGLVSPKPAVVSRSAAMPNVLTI